MQSLDTSGNSFSRDDRLKVTLKRFVRKDFQSAETSMLVDSWHTNCVLLSFNLLAEIRLVFINLNSEYFVITSYFVLTSQILFHFILFFLFLNPEYKRQ